jgi:hypothetical protein
VRYRKKGEIVMKKMAIICLCLSVVGTTVATEVYDISNFSALGRMYQPVPTGHSPGKDNGSGIGTHHPGEDCGKCHRPGGRAGSYLFTMSGTLYKDRSGRSLLKGGEIILEDREGNIISMTSNGAGNFWTYASLASDPYTISSYHGGPPFDPLYKEDSNGNLVQPADPADSRTWKYKTWVRNGDSIRPMVMIPAAGGGEAAPRMSCNMHHGGVAHRSGALWAGKEPTLTSYPASALNYQKDIYPILRSKCSPCHVPGQTMTPVNTKTDLYGNPSTSIDYSGGLDLTVYEGSDVAVGGKVFSKAGIQSVVNVADAGKSLLLLKTVYGGEPHAGGAFWDAHSPDYVALRQWILEGALKQ